MGEGKGGPGAGPASDDSDPGAQSGKAAGQSEKKMEQGPPGKAATEDKAEPGKAEGTAKTKDKAPTAGEDAPTAAEDKAPAAAEDKKAAEEKTTTEDAGTTDDKAGTSAKGEADADAKEATSVKLDSQQVSKVKTYFSEHRPTVKAVSKTEVSVSVGVAVPTSIVLYDLPPDIIVVEGECQIKYFVWGEDIVLVDSCARVVVEIIVIA